MATTKGRDIVRFIKDQHEEIRRLFSAVDEHHGDERRDAFECLVRLLAVHETAEEEAVYPVVRSADATGRQIADARVEEESRAKDMLSGLERTGVEGDDFARRFVLLRAAVLAHAENEERTVLPLLERTQDKETLDGMGSAVRVAEALAPTHPHPHGPTAPSATLQSGRWWRASTRLAT